MKLLIITQKVDQDDDLLGFFVDWLGEFAKHFERIHVITLAKGRYSLPDHVFVHSLGKELGRSKLLQLMKFYFLLFKFVPKTDGVFAHMSPLFVLASWPATVVYRKKIIFWYLHRSLTLKLKIANRLCYKIVTAAKESLRLRSGKIIEVGHGIDVQRFHVERNWELASQQPPRVLSVGRISEIKDYPTLVRSVEIIKNRLSGIKVQIVGRPVMKPDFQILESLKQLISGLNLQTNVELVGFVPYSKLRSYYENNYININLTPPGGIDKSVLEGMAAGQFTLTSNTAFRKYFGPYGHVLIFKHGDPNDLTEKLQNVLLLSAQQKQEISAFLVRVVLEQHGLKQLIKKISNTISDQPFLID